MQYTHPLPRQLRESPLLPAALDYHARGLALFPLRDKVPAVKAWTCYRKPEARPDPHLLREWFSDSDRACNGGKHINGIAVICGSPSNGLCVRDYDDVPSYRAWADSHSVLAKTLPTCRTGRGYHVWHRGRAVHRKCGDGEYLGTSRQIAVAAPSWHPTAHRLYEWTVPLPPVGTPLPEVDPVEAGLLPDAGAVADEAPKRKVRRCARGRWQTGTDLRSIAESCLPTGVGERNDRIQALVRACDVAGVGRDQLDEVFAWWWRHAEAVVYDKRRNRNRMQFQRAWELSQERLATGEASGCLNAAMQLAAGIPVPSRWQRPAALAAAFQLCAAFDQHKQHQQATLTPGISVSHPDFRRTFHLSSYVAAQLLGVSQRTAYRHLRHLEQSGVLRCMKRGDRWVGGDATEWQFVGEHQEQVAMAAHDAQAQVVA